MKVLVFLLLIGWWIVVTVTVPFLILVFAFGIPFGWTTWPEVFKNIWYGFYCCGIMDE